MTWTQKMCGSQAIHTILLGTLLVCGVAVQHAEAQNYNNQITPPPDSVTARAQPDYEALGIRTGSFLVKPSASILEIYNDNIYATNTNRISDFITVFRPKLTLDSQWNRHAFGLSLSGDFGFHANHTKEDYANFTAAQNGRLDIGGSDSLTENASFERYQEARSSVDDRKGLKPVMIDVANGELELKHQRGAIFGSLSGSISDFTFHDTRQINGALINNHDRDRTIGNLSLEVGLDTGGLVRPFVQVTGMKVDFKEPVDNFGLNRDSKGFAINGGLLFPVTTLIQGRVFGGYIARYFSDPLLSDVHTFGYGGQILWSPSRLTSIQLTGLKTADETTLYLASAALVSSAGIAIDQEVSQSFILHGGFQYSRSRYTGISRTDENWGAQAQITYLINRQFRATFGFDHSSRNAKNVPATNDFRGNRLTMTIHAQI
jgi:hypothetical protein